MTAPGQAAGAAKEQTSEVLGTAKEQAGSVTSTAAGAATDVAGTAKEQVGNVVGETVSQAKDLTAQVKETAGQQLEQQSTRLVESMKGLSSQLSNGETSGVVGRLLEEAGQRLQAVADHVERVGPQGLVEDLRSYARSNPGSFLVTAGLAGLVTGRLAKGLGSSQGSQPPSGTAAGTPLAGLEQPGLGLDSGYAPSPYPESIYATGEPALFDTGRGGAL